MFIDRKKKAGLFAYGGIRIDNCVGNITLPYHDGGWNWPIAEVSPPR
jgi:hypothetical protein